MGITQIGTILIFRVSPMINVGRTCVTGTH